jgi:hypothetical protein
VEGDLTDGGIDRIDGGRETAKSASRYKGHVLLNTSVLD